MQLSAEKIIAELNMQKHPEGGYYAETFRDEKTNDGRSVGTAIYFLLQSGEQSHWHTVDASEIWFYHAGAPLELSVCADKGKKRIIMLGPDILNGERPQGVVPAGEWQSAKSTGEWTLVSCTVSPGFEFEHFVLAPAGWTPEQG
ncbi:MAG: cupin domain-containing protein [Nitratireductor sp.]